ncbi:MAG TPA: S9 family peptidase [Candidatus Angelobacter sp.]|nr:S9 family peptidase [Candidatus Angelobacter sp.]
MSTGLDPLIPRDIIFGNPERTLPTLSPDGTRLAWLAPDANNVLQIWTKIPGANEEKIVTAEKSRGIRVYFWAKDSRNLLYLQDLDGDENYQLRGVDVLTGDLRDYTSIKGTCVSEVILNSDYPDAALVCLNARNPSLFDVHRLDLRNGTLDLDTQNPGDVITWLADAQFRVRAAWAITPEGGTEIRLRADEKAPWKTFLKAGPEEMLEVLDFTADGESLYLRSSLGRDTAAVIRKHIVSGVEQVIAAHDQVDADKVMIHPRRHIVEAVAFADGRTIWRTVDPSVEEDFAGLAKLNPGDFEILNRTDNDDVWLVAYMSDRAPSHFYSWDRKQRQGTFLFSSRPKLDGQILAEMKPIEIQTRDGLTMHSYLTLPPGMPAGNLPLVLHPHGGPWVRDKWGYNIIAQWLANRGYAVLQPNYRGSAGYGKKFLTAGFKQWGRKMHDDLIDAVNWAVDTGLADPKRIGILGGSYGGYCALAALTFTPEVFACSVDIVGTSNLKTFSLSIPPYWEPARSMLAVRMADVNDPNDAQLIEDASPLNFAHKIVRPLLIAHGANDPRVKQAEAEQIVSAIQKNQGAVTYVLYPDEGHDFIRPENAIDFAARAEAFLGQYLDGRIEPMSGEKIPGSTAIVRVVEGI